MKTISVIVGCLVVLFAIYVVVVEEQSRDQAAPVAADHGRAVDEALQQAIETRASGVPVQSQGVVTRLLADDLDGSRHQRFIIRLASGDTILIAHNIDLADRLSDVQVGDELGFSGDYEWNAQGGVVHWTHADPAGRHPGGWLEHNGRRYR